ncbi:MAG: hypothetical protein EHM46_04815, partial [Bacteroidetes bacterium]
MKGKLSDSQAGYVLDHLGHHAVIGEALKGLFRFQRQGADSAPSVLFNTAREAFDPGKVIRIRDIPVLYPVGPEKDRFYTLRGKTLEFHHDLLKSAFHLLSGYEEYRSGARDDLGRFPYSASLQKSLEIVRRPVVNYYFEVILKGLEKFCSLNGIP